MQYLFVIYRREEGTIFKGDTKLFRLGWANGEKRIPKSFVQLDHVGSGMIKLWCSLTQNHVQVDGLA